MISDYANVWHPKMLAELVNVNKRAGADSNGL